MGFNDINSVVCVLTFSYKGVLPGSTVNLVIVEAILQTILVVKSISRCY